MKTFGLVLAVAFLLSIGLSGAYADQRDSKMNAPSQEVKKEGAGMASAKDTSMKQEYEKYQKKAQKELNEYKKKMKELETKSKNLEEKAKAEANEGIKEFHREWKAAEHKLKSMKSATADAWEKMKADMDSALASVKEDYDRVAAKFKG